MFSIQLAIVAFLLVLILIAAAVFGLVDDFADWVDDRIEKKKRNNKRKKDVR